MRSWWSEPQSAIGLVFADCIQLLHFRLQRMQSIWFWYWPSGDAMCRVIFCVVGRGCLLWPECSLGKILLAFALLHFVLQGQTWLLLQVSLDFLLLHSSPLWWICSSVTQSYPTLCDHMECNTSGFPVLTISRSLLKLMSIELVMPSNHLILCHLPLLLPLIFPSIRMFSSDLALCIRWPKYWSFSFSISPTN